MSTDAGPGGGAPAPATPGSGSESVYGPADDADADASTGATAVAPQDDDPHEADAPDEDAAVDDDAAAEDAGWWHRDHPVFVALTGFFTGLVTVIVVPGVYVALLGSMFSRERAEDLFPFVLVILAVPLGLVAHPRTRRFGGYMLLGMVLTAVVVIGVAAAVLWVLNRANR